MQTAARHYGQAKGFPIDDKVVRLFAVQHTSGMTGNNPVTTTTPESCLDFEKPKSFVGAVQRRSRGIPQLHLQQRHTATQRGHGLKLGPLHSSKHRNMSGACSKGLVAGHKFAGVSLTFDFKTVRGRPR